MSELRDHFFGLILLGFSTFLSFDTPFGMPLGTWHITNLFPRHAKNQDWGIMGTIVARKSKSGIEYRTQGIKKTMAKLSFPSPLRSEKNSDRDMINRI